MTPVNQSFNDDERALARALHGRVDHMNESPLGVQDVDAKARSIRRNRRVAIGAGLAAAVAIVVPTVLVAGNLTGRDTAPPPASQSPSVSPSVTPTRATDSAAPSPSESATPAPTSQVLDVRGLDTGASPGLAYAELDYEGSDQVGGTLHAPDGREVALPPYPLMEFAALGDRWVVDVYDLEADVERVYLLGPTGDYAEPWDVLGGIAVSAGGNVVAWTGTDGTVYAAHAATGDVLTLPAVPVAGGYRTVGVLGEDCKEGRTTDAGCTVVVNREDRQSKVYLSTSHGIVDQVSGLLSATTVGTDRLGGVTSIDEDLPGSCGAMLMSSLGQLWTTCENTLSVISPDGTHLLGLPSYLDGFGPTTLDILDMADGSAVRSWTSNRRSATYFDQVWEDDAHVLVETYQGGEWAMVRLGVDGSMEYAVEPVPGEDLSRPVILQTR